MQVNPASSMLYSESQQTQKPNQNFDKDTFLNILVNQLRYQNPLSPQDSDSFINQMVQLTTIEQIANLTASMEKMLESQEFNRAVSLIGYQVTVLDSGGETVQGTVEKVTMVDGEPRLFINNSEYPLSKLVSISEPPAENPEQNTGIQTATAEDTATVEDNANKADPIGG